MAVVFVRCHREKTAFLVSDKDIPVFIDDIKRSFHDGIILSYSSGLGKRSRIRRKKDEIMEKEKWIQTLGLEKHPEGGYFRQTYLSDHCDEKGTPLFSSILFLLSPGDVSHLHVLKEDELWDYQAGEATSVYEIDSKGRLTVTKIGPAVEKGEVLQYLVKAGRIFGSAMDGTTFSLVGCLVAPAFSYAHFRLVKAEELSGMSPQDFAKVKKLLQ
jgi:predicted cupin superfamily sugar epimerase